MLDDTYIELVIQTHGHGHGHVSGEVHVGFKMLTRQSDSDRQAED